MEKIKVRNLGRSIVRVNLVNLNGKAIPINPKGFAFFDKDEVAYLRNTSKVFEAGVLKVEDEEIAKELGVEESGNAVDEAGIAQILKMSQSKLSAKLKEIDNIQVVEAILDNANDADKSVKFIEIIEKRIEELR